MRLLCLDLATRVGWACGSLDGATVSHGVLVLPDTGREQGPFLARFRDWLNDAIDKLAPDAILFEAPILPKNVSQKNLSTLLKLYQLAGVAELVAFDHDLPIEDAHLSSIRVHFVGVNKAPAHIRKGPDRTKWWKWRTIKECRSRGFNVADDNDADALAVLSYGLSLRQPCFNLTNGARHGQSAVAGI